jgi:hypothetical protein
VKLPQERIGKTMEHKGMGNNFLTITLIAQKLRDRIDKWDYCKLKSFCITVEIITKLKRYPTE